MDPPPPPQVAEVVEVVATVEPLLRRMPWRILGYGDDVFFVLVGGSGPSSGIGRGMQRWRG